MARRTEIDETTLTVVINKASISHVEQRARTISVGECENAIRLFVAELGNRGFKITRTSTPKKKEKENAGQGEV